MNNEQILEALRAMAQTLGTTVQKLWEVAMTQVYVDAIHDVITMVAMILFVIFSYRYGMTHKNDTIKPNRYGEDDITGRGASVIVLGVVSVVFVLMVMLVLVPNILTAFINPEFAAIEMISNFIQNH